MIHPEVIEMEKKQIKIYQTDANTSEKSYYQYEMPKVIDKFDVKINTSNGYESMCFSPTRLTGKAYCEYDIPHFTKYKLEKKNDSDSSSESEDDMTITSQQLDIVKQFMKVCGFDGLMDYYTKISAKDITDEILVELNKLAPEIDSLFPIHEINLRRTCLKFTTATLVMSVLRNLLTCVGIRWKSTRTKKGIFISLVSDEICDYDRALIAHESYVKNCDDCKPLELNIKCKDIVKNHNKKYFLSFSTCEYTMLKLNIKKLKITNLPQEMVGMPYYISIGGTYAFSGKLNNKNLFPTKYIPFSLMSFHEYTIYIYCDTFNPKDITLKCQLTPYIDNNKISINTMLCLPWIAKTSNILKIASGMGGLSRISNDLFEEYLKHITHKKVLDMSNTENLKFPNPYWKDCDNKNNYDISIFKLDSSNLIDSVNEIVYYYQFTTVDTKYIVYLDHSFDFEIFSISSLQLINNSQKQAKFTYFFKYDNEIKKKQDYVKNESFNFGSFSEYMRNCNYYVKVSNLEKNKQYSLKVTLKLSHDQYKKWVDTLDCLNVQNDINNQILSLSDSELLSSTTLVSADARTASATDTAVSFN